MDDLIKRFQRNKNKDEIKTILKLAGFDDSLGRIYKNLGSYLTELNQKSWEMECWVDLDKNNIDFIIVGNGMEVCFKKEISDEALIDVFDKNHNPIILKEIQDSRTILKEKGDMLMEEKERIENSLKLY